MKYTLKNKDIELTDEEVQEIVKQNNKKEEKVVGIAIKNRWTGEIIFQSTKTTYQEAIVEKGDADLCNANLRGADLSDADLRGANLSGADLSDANLSGADLRCANLSGADLCNADLFGADLCNANLRGADLCNADLRGANLSDADLRGAELNCAKFYGKGGTQKLKKSQLTGLLNALGFQVEE